jgi:hypothetical protein
VSWEDSTGWLGLGVWWKWMECRVAVGVSGVRPGAEWSCAWRVESGVGGASWGRLGKSGHVRMSQRALN